MTEVGRRVLLINYEFPPIGAGAGNAMANIARCLAATGTEVTVLTSRWGKLPASEQRDGYTIRRVPSIRLRPDRCSPLEMLSFVLGGIGPALAVGRNWRPDVTCAFFGVPSGPLALLLNRLYGIPYLVSLRGGDVPGFLGKELATLHRLSWPLTRAIWRGSSGLIANSRGLAELTLRALPNAPIRIIPNGIDVELFRPPDRVRPSDPIHLLFVGRLARQKGIRYLLEGLARARAPAVLRVVGDGPDRGELERLALELDLPGRVEFFGWANREQMPASYDWADAFVLPSLEEGMPNVILEAMAAGLPVIATNIYGNRDLVEPGRTGFLLPPANSAAIASSIDELAANPALLRSLGNGGRVAAMGRRWDGVAAEYQDALTQAARGRIRPPTLRLAGDR